MDKLKTPEIDELFRGILSLQSIDECYDFFKDLCTVKEIIDMSQRLKVAKMLNEKIAYQEIVEKTGISSATISRVSRCLEYGNGGYKSVISKLNEKKADKNL